MYIERLRRNCVLLDFPIAHKGVFGINGETIITSNSLDSIKKSIEKNIPFEVDIIKTKDDIPIIYHDFVVCVNETYFNISDLTLEELKYLTKGLIKITTLKECIDINQGQVPMILDFKETSFLSLTNYRKNIIALLNDYPAEYAIQSFNPFFILCMGKNLPNALRGQLICRGKTLIDTFKMINPKSVANLYEKLMSIICWIARADYIGLEISKSQKWNSKIEKFISDTTDDVQNTVVEIASKVTKRPIIGWTLTDLDKLNISPDVYDNYIFEPDAFENYELFVQEILKTLKEKNSMLA